MHLPTLLLTTLLGVSTPALASQQHQQQQPPPQQQQTTLTLRLPSTSPLLPNANTLPPSTHATLTTLGRALRAPLSVSNTFVFRNVTAGSYLVDVHCATHAFAPLRVDVRRVVVSSAVDDGEGEEDGVRGGDGKEENLRLGVEAWETFRGNDWGNKGAKVGVTGAGVVEVRVLGAKGYFMERSSFSVLGIFKNPMILLGLVSMALFIGMPKLVENMDPEMRAEWEERQKENPMNAFMGAASGQNSNPMGNFDMAAYLAGSSSKTDEGNGGKGKPEPKKKR